MIPTKKPPPLYFHKIAAAKGLYHLFSPTRGYFPESAHPGIPPESAHPGIPQELTYPGIPPESDHPRYLRNRPTRGYLRNWPTRDTSGIGPPGDTSVVHTCTWNGLPRSKNPPRRSGSGIIIMNSK